MKLPKLHICSTGIIFDKTSTSNHCAPTWNNNSNVFFAMQNNFSHMCGTMLKKSTKCKQYFEEDGGGRE